MQVNQPFPILQTVRTTFVVLLAILTFLVCNFANGQTFTWSSSSPGDFWNGNNWDTAPFGPNGIDHIAIIDNRPTVVGSFSLGGTGTLGEFRYSNSNDGFFNGGLLRMQTSSGQARFLVSGGSGTGRITLNSDISLISTTEFQTSNGPMVENIITGLITGNGSLRKTGSGTLVLSNNNAYLGNTFVTQGVLQVGRNAGTGSLGSGDIFMGGNGTLRYKRSNSFTVGNTISGLAGLVEKEGAGTLALTGDNRGYHGDIRIKSGTIRLGNNSTSGALGTGNVLVASGANFEFRRSNHVDIRNLISGNGNVIKNGTGTAVLFEDNTYTGGTIVNSGELRIGFGSSGSAGSGEIVNNAVVSFIRTDDYVVSNQISGSGEIVKYGTGTTIFTGSNTFTGKTTINEGILQIGNNAGAGQIGTGEIRINPQGTLRFSRSNSFTVFGTFAGNGRIEKEGLGTVALSENGTFGGLTLINAGTIRLGNNTSSGSIGSGSVNVAAGAKFEFRRSDDFEVQNRIAGGGQVIKNGAGIATLTKANTYAGQTTINFGQLRVGNGGISGQLGSGEVVNNSLLSFDRSDEYVVGNFISGAGDLIQQGSGTTILVNENNYTGSTIVNSGILRVANGSGINASANPISQVLINDGKLAIDSGGEIVLGTSGVVQVNGFGQLQVDGDLDSSEVRLFDSSRLSGSGTISGIVDVDSQSVIAPGNSIGVLEVTKDLVLSGTLEWEFDSTEDNADILVIGGNVDLTDAVFDSVALDGWEFGQTYTVMAYSGNLTGEFSNFENLGNWLVDYESISSGLNGNGGLAGAKYITVTSIPEPSSIPVFFVLCLLLPVRQTTRSRIRFLG